MDGAPDFSRSFFTIIDVTGHRDEERRMHELVETKNRFLASVSHEIRTPLTAVLGFAAMLDSGDYIDEEDLRGMISAIATHSQDVADIVEDLLVAARAETGQVDITLGPVDIIEVIAQTIAAGGSFTTDVAVVCDDEPPLAIGDATRVRQILRNLLTNAKRYGGPSVTITVGTGNGHVDIAVSDDGVGLPFSEWDRIFEPYHRAHQAAGITESVGIGLAISRQLAELMDGRLEYRYNRGRSIFTLSLPVV
jgi:signal transduction histidine kinase